MQNWVEFKTLLSAFFYFYLFKMVYIKKWRVPSESNGNIYIVSLTDKNTFACSCPAWIYRRQECKHIQRLKMALSEKKTDKVLTALETNEIKQIYSEAVYR